MSFINDPHVTSGIHRVQLRRLIVVSRSYLVAERQMQMLEGTVSEASAVR